jgi:hypothetical protein
MQLVDLPTDIFGMICNRIYNAKDFISLRRISKFFKQLVPGIEWNNKINLFHTRELRHLKIFKFNHVWISFPMYSTHAKYLENCRVVNFSGNKITNNYLIHLNIALD